MKRTHDAVVDDLTGEEAQCADSSEQGPVHEAVNGCNATGRHCPDTVVEEIVDDLEKGDRDRIRSTRKMNVEHLVKLRVPDRIKWKAVISHVLTHLSRRRETVTDSGKTGPATGRAPTGQFASADDRQTGDTVNAGPGRSNRTPMVC